MAITPSYLIAVGRLGELLEALRHAQAPERFTIQFLQNLGFTSTNDRMFVGVLKGLGFLDQNGAPQQRYYDYLDESQSKQVLADAIREAYEDLFRVNRTAYQMSAQQVKNKLKSLTQGQYSDNVLGKMAGTFAELVKFADFQSPTLRPQPSSEPEPAPAPLEPGDECVDVPKLPTTRRLIDSLSYRIEVVLPATRDKAIYDAIFRSLKEHLL